MTSKKQITCLLQTNITASGKGKNRYCFYLVNSPLPMPQFLQALRSQKFFFSPALRAIIKALVPVKKMMSIASIKHPKNEREFNKNSNEFSKFPLQIIHQKLCA
jgi:hypothetical protein